jgi:hypothetical protein
MLEDVIQIEIKTDCKDYEPKHIVLWNPSPIDLIKASKEYPKTFIFSFDTTPVEDIENSPDYSVLSKYLEIWNEDTREYECVENPECILSYKDNMFYILTPVYIGHFPKDKHESIAEQLVKTTPRIN